MRLFQKNSEMEQMLQRINANDYTFRSVILNSKGISNVGENALAKALRGNTAITCLELSDNNISYKGTKALADALQVNSSITNLYLGNNNISHEGIKALADALQVNSSITHLFLDDNNISDKGAKALADALQVNSSITHLSLRNNNISDERLQEKLRTLKEINRDLSTTEKEKYREKEAEFGPPPAQNDAEVKGEKSGI